WESEVSVQIQNGERLDTGKCALRADFSFQAPLDTRDFARKPAAMPFAVVNLDRTGNPVAVRFHSLITLFHDLHDVVPFPFQHRSHRVEPVRDPTLVDDVQRAGHILPDTLAFA